MRTTDFAPLSKAYLMDSNAAEILPYVQSNSRFTSLKIRTHRWLFATSPFSFWGTLKSTRIKTRLSWRSSLSIESLLPIDMIGRRDWEARRRQKRARARPRNCTEICSQRIVTVLCFSWTGWLDPTKPHFAWASRPSGELDFATTTRPAERPCTSELEKLTRARRCTALPTLIHLRPLPDKNGTF